MKILITIAIIAMMIPSVDAKSKVETCKSGYVGFEYNSLLDIKCRWLWNVWNKQMMKSFNQK